MPRAKEKNSITPEVKKCVINLSKSFHQELKQGTPVFSYNKIVQTVSNALNLNVRTVYRILHPSENSKKSDKKAAICRFNRKLDAFAVGVMLRIITRFYEHGEFASLRRIARRMADAGYPVSTTTLWRTLKKEGYCHYRSNGRRFLKETTDVVAARHTYLRKIRKYREEDYEIVYLDETWINANHNAPGEWTINRKGPINALYPQDLASTRYMPTGKGQRLIVLDAGSSRSGFIQDVGLIFKSKTKRADYHDEMNSKHFLEWFEHTLLPALEGPSVIVMDSAPYHNRKTHGSWYPGQSTNKDNIRTWLMGRNIACDEDETKAELLMKVKFHRPNQMFLTDKIANENGHEVLRLPVRHCELNPIELIQAQEKQYVSHNNKTFKLRDVKQLFLESKRLITVADWEMAERHVIHAVEDKLWALDGVQTEEVGTFIINLESDDEYSDNTDNDEVDDTDFEESLVPAATVGPVRQETVYGLTILYVKYAVRLTHQL